MTRSRAPAEILTPDSVTGLPDRGSFMRLLADRLGTDREEARAALALVDLDRFAAVNLVLGFDVGDAVLAEVSRRLSDQRVLSGLTVARCGPDRFAVLLDDPSASRLAAVTALIHKATSCPIQLAGRPTDISTTASVGVALAKPADTAESVVQHAEVALRAAAGNGTRSTETYDPEIHEPLIDKLRVEFELLGVADRGELVLDYQPIVDLRTREAVAVEALVRWDRPGYGRLAPAAFIGIAEAAGVIVPMGAWVLEQACREASELNRRRGPEAPLRVSVNVSARQLRAPHFIDDVAATLARVGIEPELVILEVTETAVMADMDLMAATLAQLKELGVLLALDDFGTGYSSLSYLRRLPVDHIKIDRAFVSGVASDSEEWALAVAITRLATSLGKQTIAEGIETPAQLAHLRSLGCDFGQGFLFGRPAPPETIAARNGTTAATEGS